MTLIINTCMSQTMTKGHLPDVSTVHVMLCRPKMPCLRCGCPWYSGEDWDALCMRCGWDCQVSGYNDESQPLPPYRAQWQEFTEAIRDGRTPEYTGKRTKGSSKT